MGIAAGTDTRADIGRDAVISAEIGIGVGQEEQLGLAAGIVVGHRIGRPAAVPAVKRREVGVVAVFDGDVAAQASN